MLLLRAVSLSVVAAWTCDSIVVDGAHFDLSPLAGEHTVESSVKTPPTIRHTLYTIDPCAPLKRHKDVSAEDQCPVGTQVCRTTSVEKDEKSTVIEVVPYAGDISDEKEPKVSKLKASDDDDQTQGFKLTYSGDKDQEDTKLSAVIEFICDKEVGVGAPETQDSASSDVASFTWSTKYACVQDSKDDGHKKPDHGDHDARPPKGSSWGFFTWLFLIVFMLIASFLIFTLFLNYNRYGQLGLDLVPAMDSVKVCFSKYHLQWEDSDHIGCPLPVQGLCKPGSGDREGKWRPKWLLGSLEKCRQQLGSICKFPGMPCSLEDSCACFSAVLHTCLLTYGNNHSSKYRDCHRTIKVEFLNWGVGELYCQTCPESRARARPHAVCSSSPGQVQGVD